MCPWQFSVDIDIVYCKLSGCNVCNFNDGWVSLTWTAWKQNILILGLFRDEILFSCDFTNWTRWIQKKKKIPILKNTLKPKTLWAACWNPKPFGSFSTWDGCSSILLLLHFTFTVKLVFIVEAAPLLRFYSRQGKTEIREKKVCVVFPGRLCLLWMLILRWDICTQWWAGDTKRQQRGSMTPWVSQLWTVSVPPLQFIVQHCRLPLCAALRRSDSWSPQKHWRWGRVYLDFDSRRSWAKR